MSTKNSIFDLINNLPNGDLPVTAIGTKTFYPETCKEILEYSKDVNNRKINKQRLEEYTKAMLGDKFVATGCVIWININNKLIDGQHRFWSVVNSNIPRDFFVLKLETEEGALDSYFDNNQKRTLPQLTGESKPYCSCIEFFRRILCGNTTRTTPSDVFSLRDKLADKKINELAHSISEDNFCSKKMNIQRFTRCALITAAYLGYETAESIKKVWEAFIRKDTTNPLANELWQINTQPVIDTGSTVLPQPIERENYYKALFCLKNRKTSDFSLTKKRKSNLEDFVIPEFNKAFGAC